MNIAAAGRIKGNNLSRLIEEAAARHPHRDCLRLPLANCRWTFKEYLQNGKDLAYGLHDWGWRKGDIMVTTLLDDDAETLGGSMMGAWSGIGWITLPTNATAEEITNVVRESGARGLLIDLHQNDFAGLQRLIPELVNFPDNLLHCYQDFPRLKNIFFRGRQYRMGMAPLVEVYSPNRHPSTIRSFRNMSDQISSDSLAYGTHDSRTTHDRSVEVAENATRILNLTPTCRVLTAVPWHVPNAQNLTIWPSISAGALSIVTGLTPSDFVKDVEVELPNVIISPVSRIRDVATLPNLADYDFSKVQKLLFVTEHEEEREDAVRFGRLLQVPNIFFVNPRARKFFNQDGNQL